MHLVIRISPVHIVDGSLLKVAGVDFVFIYKDLILDFVLMVPNLDCNLLSNSKLAHEKTHIT